MAANIIHGFDCTVIQHSIYVMVQFGVSLYVYTVIDVMVLLHILSYSSKEEVFGI